MPLEQRVIQPIYVSRGCFQHGGLQHGTNQSPPINIPNELECVTNGTLGNIIRQLSSLSKHAENLFGCLLDDLGSMLQRSAALHSRIESLTHHVEHLDASNDNYSHYNDPYQYRHNMAVRKPSSAIHRSGTFGGVEQFDQQVVARTTIPDSLREVYERCDPPPPLDKLNPFRDDTINGLKLYTNPNYFFELWRKEMLQETSNKTSKSSKLAKNKQGDNIHSSGSGFKSSKRNRQQQKHPQLQYQSSTDTNSYSQQSLPPPPPPANQQQYHPSIQQQQHYHSGYYSQQQQNTSGHVQQQQMEILTAKQMNPGSGVAGSYTVIEGSYIDPNNYQHHYVQHQYNNANAKSGSIPASYQLQSTRPSSLELQHQQQQQQQYYYNNQQSSYVASNQTRVHSQAQYSSSNTMSYPTVTQSQQQQHTPPQQHSPSATMTPTRRLSGAQVSRPSAPPPAPPGGSGNSSNANSQPGTPRKTTMMINGQEVEMRQDSTGGTNRMTVSRDSLPPPPPPPLNAQLFNGALVNSMADMDVHDAALPPPPPPPPPTTTSFNGNQNSNFTSPPPPPPPPTTGNGQIQQNNQYKTSTAAKPTAEELKSVVLKKIDPNIHHNQSAGDPADDVRSNLLAAIRHGIKLKRVAEETRQREVEQNGPLHDVASILARRVAMELSDSDGVDGEDDGGDDSDPWDDESEC